MKKTILFALFSGFIMYSCGKKLEEKKESLVQNVESKIIDTQTYAIVDKAKITHLFWDVAIDFDEKVIKGSATYDIENNNANEIYFDTEKLSIDSVFVGGTKKAVFHLGDQYAVKGKALRVEIEPTDKQVTIYYKTSPQANALQWLEPSQTHDKKFPFLLTQGEAILTRSYIPIQDTPSIRITYDAKVKVPKDLMAVMSAANPKKKASDGVYSFKMDQAIPPYLIALAVGDLEYKAIDSRTGVYAEKGQIKAAVSELADMGKMLRVAENLYGEYPWKQFDVLILPSSFPFGGMENPRLTFATPTIIVGDRSLTNLIAHELAHSWSGNLVTNATWDDFWLNEGFTVYFERRIMEAMEGKDYADMLSVIGYQDLQTAMQLIPEKFTSLYIDFEGTNPDDGFSAVPYDKGYLFLKMLEDKYGREKFDVFVKKYFEDNKFKTITTERFIVYLKANLIGEDNGYLQEWIYAKGLPKEVVKPTSVKFTAVEEQLKVDCQTLSTVSKVEVAKREWSTNEWIHYIRLLDAATLTPELMEKLDTMYNFTNSNNAEIQCAWYEKAFMVKYKKAYPQAKKYLIHIGRIKFLEPLYLALKQTNQLDVAKDVYKEAKPNYHPLAKDFVEQLLEK
jgi:aminopeptidase N